MASGRCMGKRSKGEARVCMGSVVCIICMII